MKNACVKVYAPATVANVSCGFDIFGFAVESPGDELVITLQEKSGVVISSISGAPTLPKDPKKNAASASILAFLEAQHIDAGFDIQINKKMPLGSGLGSSAASSAAGVFGANFLLGSPLNVSQLIPFAMEGERVCCGIAHADNVAPCLLGGFTLIKSYEPLEVVVLDCKLPLYCTLLHPKIEILTSDARKILKPTVTLQQLVAQTGNAAGLVAGLLQGDQELIRHSLQDVVVELVRKDLIPGFDEIKAAALSAGALGCGISGSGPSLFALSLDINTATLIGDKMGETCSKYQDYHLYISKISLQGARVIPC